VWANAGGQPPKGPVAWEPYCSPQTVTVHASDAETHRRQDRDRTPRAWPYQCRTATGTPQWLKSFSL